MQGIQINPLWQNLPVMYVVNGLHEREGGSEAALPNNAKVGGNSLQTSLLVHRLTQYSIPFSLGGPMGYQRPRHAGLAANPV